MTQQENFTLKFLKTLYAPLSAEDAKTQAFALALKAKDAVLVRNEQNNPDIQEAANLLTYSKLLEKAKMVARSSRKVIFFQYGGELSLSADLANELSYRFPGKVLMLPIFFAASTLVRSCLWKSALQFSH